LRAAALVAGATLVLSACGGGQGGSEVRTGTAFAECTAKPNTCNSAAAGQLQQGGDLTYALEKNVSNWNMLSSEGNVFDTGLVLRGVLPATFNTLPDLTLAMNTSLLESAKITGTNPETIVYKIKDNAAWSDGTPIAADDFIYQWKVMNGRDCPNCSPSSTSGYDQIQSVVGSDNNKTVTVTLSKPYTDWKNLWSSGNPIYPAHIAAKHGDTATPAGLASSFDWFAKNVPSYSGGPFQISQFQNNNSVTLVPNPAWYGPIPNLSRVIFRIITDAAQEPNALQNREVQVIYPQPELDLVNQVRNMAGVSSTVGLGLSWEHADLNLANPFLAAKPLRTALFTAVDRQAIINKTVGQFAGKVPPLNNHNFVPQQRGYQDVVTQSGQGAGKLDQAKKILTDAGYKIQGDQLIAPDGKPVPPMRIRYTGGNQIRQTECQLIAAQVKPLGITLQVVPTDDLGGTLQKGDFDVMVYAWVASPFPYANAVQTWVTGQGNNFGHYSNPEVDRLIAAASSETDEAQAVAQLNQSDRLMTEDAYVLPLYQKATFIALDDKVANVRNNSSLDGPPYNIQDWGLRKK
jgi:peptide/nickel transport system substrate-binding protein